MDDELDTSKIKSWRSIITLIIFVITNIIVLFPFHIPIYVPRWITNGFLDLLGGMRIIPRRTNPRPNDKQSIFVKFRFPLNFVTAPLIADLFLLAILAIGRKEVHDGIVGAENINPIDIMVFFLTLAYIAISIDASGLIRYLAFKVLQKAGKVGHRLFFYLFVFFFGLGSFIGNDPIILSGTAFLAYMTRVSSNIVHPRAWIHSQFAIANIASAILVSSNPTNLVLAGAFKIKFIVYTANMIVPVVVTAIVLFPLLLYIIFADESLIPLSITMHELSEDQKKKPPVNPNIPNARGTAEEKEEADDTEGKQLSLEEIMNPFLDKTGASFGGIIMAATLITLLAINASGKENPVFWVTLPAAFVMFCWDIAFGWKHRHETREIAAKGRQEVEDAQEEREMRKREEEEEMREREEQQALSEKMDPENFGSGQSSEQFDASGLRHRSDHTDGDISLKSTDSDIASKDPYSECGTPFSVSVVDGKEKFPELQPPGVAINSEHLARTSSPEALDSRQTTDTTTDVEKRPYPYHQDDGPRTLVSIAANIYRWSQETFPTMTVVVSHMPFALVPFAFTMFILVQALVTKGWVPVFAYGWNHWVEKTGTIGSIGGMGFLSVILCNFAGTNIGTTILLSRVIQAWQKIHDVSGVPISDRTWWATVYSMALGVNYGAFSTAFSASLAGMLWRDILARKHIRVGGLEFARVNLPIIAISMVVGCTVLLGEVYIVRSDTQPYVPA
ncbi:Arsenical pump membrane protein, ArsB [Penicillium griseofulvum]|uniref:Arsenical pump membrane protein, ArsB n=1 Tax=Penicillium patulum TaxID=5078 RepID=A0A135LU89_PENPA|nr:Arsenical pump membrane protein, ArsB [Penicillium griseofulvum]KXG52481.1 Arsenical pump membrane protein, ArsB [Penicillium griseofulvum]